MTYEFQTIDISIFDFHEAVNALQDSAVVRPEFQFLNDPKEYNTQYESGKPIQTANFRVRPMGWRTMAYHFFWKYYQLIHHNGGPDFWRLQLPFACHPTQAEIKLVTGSHDFEGIVRPIIFLSAMGWSTHLRIRLSGHMKPSHVQNFIGSLANKSIPPFQVNGLSKILPEVFEFFTDQIRKDIYTPSMIDALKVRRYLVMTLSQYTGERSFYRGNIYSGKQMPAADRALFHSMLRGTALAVPDLIRLENEKKFLITRFINAVDPNNPDFAITYFDYGTLVFMQRSVNGQNRMKWKARRGPMRCHTANIRNYLFMTLSLYAFYRDMAKEATANQKIKDLREGIRMTLVELPYRYTSLFSQSFHQNYGPLGQLSKPS